MSTIHRVPTLPGKPGILPFSFPGLENGICSKVVQTWNFNSKPGKKKLKFANSMFEASLFKMSFTKIILIYFCVISTLSTHTLIRSEIDLGFHCIHFIAFVWKIHGILCHKKSGNLVSVLTQFKIFIAKIALKVPGIWHKKP